MKTNSPVSRRQIIKGATVVAAASAFRPFFPGRVLGANDRINVAVVGVHSRGGAHIKNFGKIPGVQVKTLVDIDENLLAHAVANVASTYKNTPGTAFDMRRVFDDKDIDIVSFATPNHWHALGAIWAAQAKKNVYVEKPASHTIFEGRQMVNAARKYGVLMQVGFQNRSRLNTTAAMEYLHTGKLGKVFMARGLCYKPRINIGRLPDGPQAAGDKAPPGSSAQPFTAGYLEKVHYDLWTGPAELRPFNANRFHYNWHWQFAFGNGDTGNQGPHQFDVGRWGINKDEYPVRIRSVGGVYGWGDTQQDTPNTQTSVMEYADGTIFEFATRGLNTNADGKIKIGNIFYGSEGRLEIDDGGNWNVYAQAKGSKDEVVVADSSAVKEEKSDPLNLIGSGDFGHFHNFIKAVRAGKREELNCDIEAGHRSSVLAHLSNISYRLGREITFDGKTETFGKDAAANKLLHRNDRKGFAIPKLPTAG